MNLRLKVPRGKVRALFSNSLSTTSLSNITGRPTFLRFLFYLLRQKSEFATSVCNTVCDMASEKYILENRYLYSVKTLRFIFVITARVFL